MADYEYTSRVDDLDCVLRQCRRAAGLAEDELAVVLLVAAKYRPEDRTAAFERAESFFLDTCITAFQQSSARFLNHAVACGPFTIACAWLPAPGFESLAIAARIQQALLNESPFGNIPCALGIGIDERSASQVLQTAGTFQIVFDPELWNGLQIHAPDFTNLRNRLGRLIGGTAKAIPWNVKKEIHQPASVAVGRTLA